MKLYLLLEEGEPNAILFGTIDAYTLLMLNCAISLQCMDVECTYLIFLKYF